MSAVLWGPLSAEEALAALDARPVILGSWVRWGFSKGFTRFECPPWREGDRRSVSVQPSDKVWVVTGFGEYGTYLTAANEEDAMALADKLSLERGWKLMSTPSLPISETK